MIKLKGYSAVCNRCNSEADMENEKRLPPGWLVMQYHMHAQIPGEFLQCTRSEGIHLCPACVKEVVAWLYDGATFVPAKP